MLVIPALDLREGRVVRLAQGDYARQTTYAADPVATATDFADQGARRIHVVDLDAARGRPHRDSRRAMAAIIEAMAARGVQTEVGGGVRTVSAARSWVGLGATAVVIGSVALREPDVARELCEALPGQVMLGLDVRGGEARAQGWTEAGGAAVDHVRRWCDWPAAGIIHTDTDRDGMMAGPDVAGLAALRAAYPGAVYASGGIAVLDDIAACAATGVSGVVIGRALYERGIDLVEALHRFDGPATP